MKIKEIKAKSCLNKCGIKGIDYVINPYVGCPHACRYCYAVFIKRFRKIKDDWGKFVYVKMNCSELLEKELRKAKPGYIWMSSVTDCYNPIEGKYKITRKILEKLIPYKKKFKLGILTKSVLVRRDFDLLKELSAELGMTINTLDDKKARILEPCASSPKGRIETLRDAKKKGIKIYGFISPVIPGINDMDLEEVFKELKFCDYVWIEVLNTRKPVMDRLMYYIKKDFPEGVKELEDYMKNKNKYYNKIKKQVKQLSSKYNLKVKGVVLH